MPDNSSDDQKNIQIKQKEQVEAGYVILPYDAAQFKDFIKSLLGSPQTIAKFIPGAFAIDINDIRNLHQLISQRVTQQNEGILAQFKARISFSDNSSVELNSIADFLSYNEVRPVVSQAVHLTWDFVVKFQDKETPERQRIQISMIGSGRSRAIIDDDTHFLPLSIQRAGYIHFRIEHTARTWGADIEALLTNHLQSMIQSRAKFREFISTHSGKISVTVALCFFLASLVGCVISIQQFSKERLNEVSSALQAIGHGSKDVVSDKIDYIANQIASNVIPQFYFGVLVFFFVSVVLSILFAFWVETSAENPEQSFVLLTKKLIRIRIWR